MLNFAKYRDHFGNYIYYWLGRLYCKRKILGIKLKLNADTAIRKLE